MENNKNIIKKIMNDQNAKKNPVKIMFGILKNGDQRNNPYVFIHHTK